MADLAIDVQCKMQFKCIKSVVGQSIAMNEGKKACEHIVNDFIKDKWRDGMLNEMEIWTEKNKSLLAKNTARADEEASPSNELQQLVD